MIDWLLSGRPVPTASIAVGFSFLMAMFRRRREQGTRPRALSFNSAVMMQSSFPAAVNMIDPLINATLTLQRAPSKEQMVQMLTKLKTFDRFMAVPTRGRGGCFMERQEVDIEAHLIWDKCADGQAAWRRVEEVILTPLSIDKTASPWWEIVVIQPENGDQTIILFRIHHIIGDGISLVQAMNTVFSDANGEAVDISMPGLSSSRRRARPSILTLTYRFFRDLVHCAALAKSSFDSMLAFTAQDKRRMLYTGNRKIIFFPNVELEFIKQLKNGLNVTVNDIMLGAVAGAILRYCKQMDDPVLKRAEARAQRGMSSSRRSEQGEDGEMLLSGLLMRALVPVAVPRESPASDEEVGASLRNRWAFASVKLPMNSGTAKARAKEANATMNGIKQSLVIPIQIWLQNHLLANSPRFFINDTCYDTFKRHSMVFSNVPGPTFPVYVAGQRVTGIQMIFPNLIAQVGIISYDGQVGFNMVLDDNVVKNPDLLRQAYVQELRDLAQAAGVEFPEAIALRSEKPAGLGLLSGEAL